MEPNNETTSQSFRYEGTPSEGVIEAVGWVNGVEPTMLTPLQEVIDADALDALFGLPKRGNLSVSFEYEDCEVEVKSDGTITVREVTRPIREELGRAANVLLLTPFDGSYDDETCTGLLSTVPYNRANVLGVTFDPRGTDRLDAWEFEGEVPAQVSIITVGDFTRSSASRPVEDSSPPERVQIDTVANPDDLTTLGLRIGEQLSEWETAGGQSIVCFHSLTDLLENTELNQVFQFLHVLMGRLSSAGAISHFHLDSRTSDDRTVNTLRPLFDAVLEVDEDGTMRLQ
jgi:hypothetical protein